MPMLCGCPGGTWPDVGPVFAVFACFGVFCGITIDNEGGSMTQEPIAARSDYAVSKVAKMFNCTAGTVTSWIKHGRLTAYRLGGTGHWRVPWAEVERLRADWTYSPKI